MRTAREPWWACLAAALAAVVSFGCLLVLALASCSLVAADCNTSSFLVLPVFAVAAGVPAMLLLCYSVLLPARRYFVRRGQPTRLPLAVIGALPGLVLAVLALVHEGRSSVPHSLLIIAYVWVGLGMPGVVGALVFDRVSQRVSRTDAAGLPAG